MPIFFAHCAALAPAALMITANQIIGACLALSTVVVSLCCLASSSTAFVLLDLLLTRVLFGWGLFVTYKTETTFAILVVVFGWIPTFFFAFCDFLFAQESGFSLNKQLPTKHLVPKMIACNSDSSRYFLILSISMNLTSVVGYTMHPIYYGIFLGNIPLVLTFYYIWNMNENRRVNTINDVASAFLCEGEVPYSPYITTPQKPHQMTMTPGQQLQQHYASLTPGGAHDGRAEH
jgi:hypothetical protein